jgi:hypothetical protein
VLGLDVSYALRNYISVLYYIHPNPQDPFYKSSAARWVTVEVYNTVMAFCIACLPGFLGR